MGKTGVFDRAGESRNDGGARPEHPVLRTLKVGALVELLWALGLLLMLGVISVTLAALLHTIG
jgi:hypothetical protein